MARILITGIPTYGQANPTFGLTAALVAAGHRVDYLMPEAFRAEVERCGATAIPYADYLGGRPVDRPFQALGARFFFNELTAESVRHGSDYDLVVATGVQPQFAEIQQRLSVPVVRFSPMFWQNERTFTELAAQARALPPLVRHGLQSRWLRRTASQVAGRALFGNHGRDLIDLLAPQSSTLNLTVSSRYLQPRADDFDDTCVYLGTTVRPRVADTSFPLDRLRQHPGPVIYVSLGTIYNGWTGYYRRIARAFANTDALVVLSLARPGAAADIGPVADNVMVHSYVPQAAVLAEADLCFTHGGFGTITEAAHAGVPMVVTPLGGDQFFNAYRLQELHAARVIPAWQLSVDRIRNAAEAILGGRTPLSGVDALGASLRGDAGGVNLGVARIEALL
jgi:MGT family glycosyltransferase